MCSYHDTLSGITLKLYYDEGKDIRDMMHLVVDQRFYLHTAYVLRLCLLRSR